jgi:glucose/arabinose dehydrogenase
MIGSFNPFLCLIAHSFMIPKTLSLLIAATLLSQPILTAGEELPFKNPIPEPLEWGDLTLHLEKWLTFPATSDKAPKSRINLMRPSVGNSDRLWVNDLRGLLYYIEDDEIHTYLDLRDYLPDFDDSRGLAGGFNFFTFHPDFEKNGLFYTVHTESPGSKVPDFVGPVHIDRKAWESILVEWKADDPKANTFSGKHREMMRVRFPIQIHTMQEIAFNPLAKPGDNDYGLLYIGIGEGGSVISQLPNNVNRLDSILGTIARIDPRGSNSANGKYGIPDDNPWANDGDPKTLGEIWTYGFRNPHSLTWDTQGDGKLLITDIGEHSIEEINLGKPGLNYGWPHREGTFEFSLDPNIFGLSPLPEDDSGFTYPVAQFDHSEGDAIAAGYVYRGKKHPLLKGKYVFGEIVKGYVFYSEAADFKLGHQTPIKKMRLKSRDRETTMADLTGIGRVDLRLGIDGNNELYLMDKATGSIYRISEVTQE